MRYTWSPALPAAGSVGRGGWWRAALLLLLWMIAARPAAAQDGAVGGTVVDARTLQPIAGAQVAVEGTQRGALTNNLGRFQITGLDGPTVTLRVVMLGFRPLSQVARVGQTDVRLALEQTAIELDEVVVTGQPAGVQQRSIGNVVARMDVANLSRTSSARDVSQLINARVPGVMLQNTSGAIGAGPRIQIRGQSSLSLSTQPLIYVDGVRVDNSVGTGPTSMGARLNDIDPSTIESIEIIKGPAAATLYGTEASAGVIQIITKKGLAGGGAAISLQVRQGVNWFMDAVGRFPTYYYKDPSTGDIITANLFQLEKARGTPVFQNGHNQEYQLEVRAGGSASSYYFSGAYANNQGITPVNGQQRFTGRANLGFSPRQSLNIQLNQGVVIDRTRLDHGAGGSNVLTEALWGGLSLLDTPTRGFLSRPPEIVYAASQRGEVVDRYTGSMVINHRPAEWFMQRLTAGLDLTDDEGWSLTPRMTPDIAAFYSPFAAQGSKSVDRQTRLYTTVDYSGTVTLPITGAWKSATSVGGQYYRKSIRYATLSGTQFPAPGVTTISGAAQQIGTDDYLQNITVGFFVQEQVSFYDRLFFTGALRADANSAFGTNFKAAYYPKASATWVVTEEPFWHLPFVEKLKLRAAYGASGQQPDAFAAVQTFQPRPGPGGTAAVTPQSIGNPNLGPERGQEFEAGFDAGFLQDRVSIAFTYYHKATTDAILQVRTAPSYGFPGFQYINAGSILNSGIELLTTGRVVSRRNVGLDLTLNLATNHSEILDLGGESFIARGEVGGYRVGYPVNAVFNKRVVSAKLDASGEPVDVLCDGGPNAAPLPCGQAPRVYLGRGDAPIIGAFSTTLTLFDRIHIFGLVDFQTGFKKFNKEWWNRCPWGIAGNCPERVFPERFSAEHIAEFYMGDIGVSSSAVENGSFAKLREISIDYTLPQRLASRIGASHANVTLAARNLHTWTKYTGFDPESLSPQAFGASRWGDQGVIPQLAQFVTTLKVTF